MKLSTMIILGVILVAFGLWQYYECNRMGIGLMQCRFHPETVWRP